MRAALVLHDVFYECAPGADETASSDYAGDFLRKIMAREKLVKDSQQIILATASHKAAEDDFPTRLFLDMDMAILAARPDIYARYVAGVSSEFCAKLAITLEQFEQARAERFLTPALNSKARIFTTEPYRELEPLARSNMRKELNGHFSAKSGKGLRR